MSAKRQPATVPRTQYDLLSRVLEGERKEKAALLERYHALALQAHPTAPAPAPSVPAKRKRSVIQEAIREEAGGDLRLSAYLNKRARELKNEKNLTPQQIADELRTWQSTEHEERES